MGLESGTYISDLNVVNPTGTDTINFADDHLRLIKSVLKNTFPNITGAVTQTHTQINQGVVPIGCVLMWTGSASSVPTGWALCDGGAYTRTDGGGTISTPDLRSRFVQGCGGSTASPSAAPTVGTTGGSASVTPTISVAGYALTQADLPNVSFPVTEAAHTHPASSVVTDPGHSHTLSGGSSYYPGNNFALNSAGVGTSTSTATTGLTVATTLTAAKTNLTVASGGSGTTHTHGATASAVSTMSPYYTLAFICKI